MSPAERLIESVVAEARADFADHLRTAVAEGPVYLERYARQAVLNKADYPHPPLTMHSKMRELVRELVRDAVVLGRR